MIILGVGVRGGGGIIMVRRVRGPGVEVAVGVGEVCGVGTGIRDLLMEEG